MAFHLHGFHKAKRRQRIDKARRAIARAGALGQRHYHLEWQSAILRIHGPTQHRDGLAHQRLCFGRVSGRNDNPAAFIAERQRIADAWAGLKIMRYTALRVLSGGEDGTLKREALISKLYWATWHRKLGELAMDVAGPDSLYTRGEEYELDALQKLFLFSRSDTIYAGNNEVQRNIIAERALGLPRGDRQ